MGEKADVECPDKTPNPTIDGYAAVPPPDAAPTLAAALPDSTDILSSAKGVSLSAFAIVMGIVFL